MSGDLVGHRRVLLAVAALVSICSLVGGAADGFSVLIVTRFVKGIEYIAVISAAPVLIVRAAANRDRPVAFGVWSVHIAIGMAAMLVLSPFVIDGLGDWRVPRSTLPLLRFTARRSTCSSGLLASGS